MSKYNFLEGTDHEHRIYPLCGSKIDGKKFYEDLKNILSQEYPGAELDFMYDINGGGDYVIAFETQEDCLMFAMKYSHIYG